jgi:nucleotide-binding universal stress UspA family protein
MKQAKRKTNQPGTIRTQASRKLIPNRILVPVDFSETSLEAWTYALEYAGQFGAELVLLHVVEPAPFVSDLKNVLVAKSDQEVAQAAQLKLDEIAPSDSKLASPVKKIVRIGRAYQEITDAAKQQKANLIIISTHGYTGLKHTLLGSTAERVVQHAPCPVLIVRKQQW